MAITRKIVLDRADRLQRMPVDPDSSFDRMAERLANRGVEIIDLSRSAVGLQDEFPTRPDTGRRQPATESESAALREAVAMWYEARFHVRLSPRHEVCAVPNTATGLCLLMLAFVDVGDVVLLPDPGLPVYRRAVVLSGGGVMPYYLWERNDFLPNFAALEAGLAGRVHLMILSYPHNPTASMADLGVLTQCVAFARRHNILVVFDAAMTQVSCGPTRPCGLLETAGGRGAGVEIFPIGANFGCPDQPLAIIAGNRDVVSAVDDLLQGMELRPDRSALAAAVDALQNADRAMESRCRRLEVSRRILVEAFSELGGMPRTAPTVPFLWASVPTAVGAEGFCRRLLRRAGVRLRPGTVYGERGEGFVRAVIPEDAAVAQAVAERLRRHAHLYQRRIPRAGRLRRRKKTDSGEQSISD